MEIKYQIDKLTIEDAYIISTWKYEGIYDFYSLTGNEEEIKELLEENYYCLKNELGEIIGYYCFGKSAQVPAGNKLNLYEDNSYLDIGLGLIPSLTGKGMGVWFLGKGIQFAMKTFDISMMRLTVATFNKRAIKTYEKIGFKKDATFESLRNNKELVQFVIMYLDNLNDGKENI